MIRELNRIAGTKQSICNLSPILSNDRGVTLVEMMVYMVVAGMMLATAVTAFMGQNESYNRQDVIAEIQQNIRGATEQMASDIRYAGLGFHATGDDAFHVAEADYFAVSYWSDLSDYWRPEMRGVEKTIHYRLNGTNLERNYSELDDPAKEAYWRTLAENIEVIKFEYLVDTGDPPDTWEWFNQIPKAGEDYEVEDIRAVKIMILGASRDSAFNQDAESTFVFPMDDVAYSHPVTPNSGYKRLMSTVVQTRNNRD